MILWNIDLQSTVADKLVACSGNFFLADYRVQVNVASNTSIAWKPKWAHRGPH